MSFCTFVFAADGLYTVFWYVLKSAKLARYLVGIFVLLNTFVCVFCYGSMRDSVLDHYFFLDSNTYGLTTFSQFTIQSLSS